MSQYEVVWKAQTENFTIERHDGDHGYFEHNELGDEFAGELWFERISGIVTLIDYDGVFALPEEVWKTLEEHQIHVPQECKA